jgi:hypothetical protein
MSGAAAPPAPQVDYARLVPAGQPGAGGRPGLEGLELGCSGAPGGGGGGSSSGGGGGDGGGNAGECDDLLDFADRCRDLAARLPP